MRRKQHSDSHWISISDMMTGLMVIFMFIAVNYIMQVIEHKFVENDLYNHLSRVFVEEVEAGDIRIGPDGTVTLMPNDPNNRFALGETAVNRQFGQTLEKFIPKYLDIILNQEYLGFIKEIRIEGHSDTVRMSSSQHKSGYDNYEDNLWLSSERAQSVLRYIRSIDYYANLNDQIKERLDFLFSANGRSFAHSLNSTGVYSYLDPEKEIDNQLSRRVEFRIITSNEKIIDNLISQKQ